MGFPADVVDSYANRTLPSLHDVAPHVLASQTDLRTSSNDDCGGISERRDLNAIVHLQRAGQSLATSPILTRPLARATAKGAIALVEIACRSVQQLRIQTVVSGAQ